MQRPWQRRRPSLCSVRFSSSAFHITPHVLPHMSNAWPCPNSASITHLTLAMSLILFLRSVHPLARRTPLPGLAQPGCFAAMPLNTVCVTLHQRETLGGRSLKCHIQCLVRSESNTCRFFLDMSAGPLRGRNLVNCCMLCSACIVCIHWVEKSCIVLSN